MLKYLKNKPAKALALIIALTGFFYTPANSQENVIDQVIAVVGNNLILKSDIEAQFAQMNNESYKGVDLKCDILEELLFQNLLIHQAELDSVEITDKEVSAQLDHRIRYFVSQVGSEKKLEQHFNKSILEIKEDLREVLKKQMLAERMQDQLTGDIKITPTEVREYFKAIPSDSLPTIPEEYEYEQIVRYPTITDAEKLAVKEKLNEMRERVLKGDKFATLAVLYSEDPGSSAKGGELGFVGRTDLVPEFAAVAFNLKEGEVSRIVETEFGYHIIQLIERRGEQVNVRHILLSPKVSVDESNNAKKLLDSVLVIVNLDSMKFADAAQKFSQDENSKNNGGLAVNMYTGNSRFEIEHIDPQTSYTIKRMKVGEVSKPFEYTDERGRKAYKIVRLKTKSPSHVANLQQDYQKILDAALADKKQKKLMSWLTNKVKSTYIHIDESYRNCQFKYSKWGI